jgi:hypothetical protein
VGLAYGAVTERVYRHQLKPVIIEGAETMNSVFSKQKAAVQDASPAKEDASPPDEWLPVWLPGPNRPSKTCEVFTFGADLVKRGLAGWWSTG